MVVNVNFLKFIQTYWVAIVSPIIVILMTVIGFWQKIKPIFQLLKDKITKHSKVNMLHETIKKQNDELNSTLSNMQKQLSDIQSNTQSSISEMKKEMNERLTKQDNVLNVNTNDTSLIRGEVETLIQIYKNK